LLAVLQEETGSDVVEPLLGESAVSAVNLSEAAGKLVDGGLELHEVRQALESLGLAEVRPFTHVQAYQAGELRRSLPKSLSLGDRACLSTGWDLGVPIYTTEREWADIKVAGLSVKVIR
jgi:PIN domain nuclease of toxin-antitoxin system